MSKMDRVAADPNPDDGAVIESTVDAVAVAFAQGEADALRHAYERHGALIHTLCARTVGHDAAADVTQEVFIAAWKSRASFDPDRGALAGWLVGVARFKVIAHLRSGARVPEPRAADNNTADPIQHVDAIADQLLINDALATLPERMRVVVAKAFFEDMTHEQIAHSTGLPIGTVKSDIRRGLQRLRVLLEANDDVRL